MSANSTTDLVGGRVRSRAKKACKPCNSRRVRCNVMEEQPCKNCKTAEVLCELMNSRRGKYERHPNHTRKSNQPNSNNGGGVQGSRDQHSSLQQDNAHTNQHNGSNGISQRGSINDVANGGPIPPYIQTTPASTESPRNALNGADTTVFLGESSSISLVHGPQSPSAANHFSLADKTKLRYPIPDEVSLKTTITPFESRRRTARFKHLTTDGAFTYPSDDVCEVLLGAYFEWFHPCFPILDRHTFHNAYLTKTVSPLLFRAVLFVGATHCNEKIMQNLGFPVRQDARNEMYNHAKDIYDADYESDKITVCQALFLMSFWRAGPLLEKDTRHWLGAAISLAQTNSVSRTANSNYYPQKECIARWFPIAISTLFKLTERSRSSTNFTDGKLRKRIWWSLYVRDRQCSAALGLPTRIRDEDCDIEMLEPSDFEEAHSAYPEYLGSQRKEHIVFAIQMAKLMVYLGKIVLREFSPISLPKNDQERSQLKDDILKWEEELSPEMRTSATTETFWAGMLHLSYNNLYILLYRSAYLSENDDHAAGNIALQAACRNTRIIEDVLSQDIVQHLNVHITTSLFNSLCIHTICLRRSQNTTRKLAEYRAQLCLLGLRELQKTWDVTNWVLQLFLQFLDQSTAKRLQLVADAEDAPGQQSATGMVSTHRPLDSLEVGPDYSIYAPNLGTGYTMNKVDEAAMAQSLDFASHLFGTKEAEDFSMFQLQPDLFTGDLYGGGLDEYYNSVMPRADGMGDGGLR